MSKNITIGILLLAIIISGTLWYRQVQQQKAMEREIEKIEADTAAPGGHWHGDEWHAEPHPEHTGPATPLVEVEVEVEDVVAEPLGLEQPVVKTRERPPMWMNIDGEIPLENAPRPFKHINNLEEEIDGDTLSDEDWLHLQNEFFFRMPKDARDTLRKQRARQKEADAFFKTFYEQFPHMRPSYEQPAP